MKIKQNKQKLWGRDRTSLRPCHYCRDMISYKESTTDHVMPKSKGGSSKRGNLVICCFRCNQRKGAVPPQMALRAIAGIS